MTLREIKAIPPEQADQINWVHRARRPDLPPSPMEELYDDVQSEIDASETGIVRLVFNNGVGMGAISSNEASRVADRLREFARKRKRVIFQTRVQPELNRHRVRKPEDLPDNAEVYIRRLEEE